MCPDEIGGREVTDVLLVDDDAAAIEEMAECLEAAGFSVRQAHSGEAALDAFSTCPPRVMIVDLRMPGLQGGALISFLDRIGTRTALVAMSGDSSALADEAVTRHALWAVRKPIPCAQLVDLTTALAARIAHE